MSLASSIAPVLRGPAAWRYAEPGGRDLRIDFMRGFVFVLLFTAHFDTPTWLMLVGWERLGVVSSAETFILLAGLVTGAVYSRTLHAEGLAACTGALWRRAWELYRIVLLVAGTIALLRWMPGLETGGLTSFRDPVTGSVYPLYPDRDAGLAHLLAQVLLLRAGPHQFQIVGLYVVLFAATPLIFWALACRRTVLLLALSWAAYLLNLLWPETEAGTAPLRPTGAQFEYAFPLLAWQLPFVHGIAAGFHRERLAAFFSGGRRQGLVAACTAASLGFALFSLNHPLPEMPDWARLSWLAPETFDAWYRAGFLKYRLGPGRLLNNGVLLVAVHALLTAAWVPLRRAAGWLFVPLGQQTMYVFVMHVALILLVANTPLPARHDIWINTAVQAGALLLCCAMVRTRFLFRWVPH